jgi:hypothetical protein
MANYFHLLNTLKGHFNDDPFINTVTEGDIFKVDLAKQTIFPLTHIIVNSSAIENNVIRFNVSILCMDIVDISKSDTTDQFIGNDNEQDVLNTMYAVQNRLYESLRRGNLFSVNFMAGGNATLEPFAERFENYLAGWTMTLDILMPNSMTIC